MKKLMDEKEAVELARRKIVEAWNKYCGTPELGYNLSEGDQFRPWRNVILREMIIWEGTPDKGMILIDRDEGWVKAFQTHTGGKEPIAVIRIPDWTKRKQTYDTGITKL